MAITVEDMEKLGAFVKKEGKHKPTPKEAERALRHDGEDIEVVKTKE